MRVLFLAIRRKPYKMLDTDEVLTGGPRVAHVRIGKGIGEGIGGFKAAMRPDEDKSASTGATVADDQILIKG